MSKIEKLKECLMSMTEIVSQIEADRIPNLGDLPYKVIHLKENPSQFHSKTQYLEAERLKKENERLKAQLDILESGNNNDITSQIDNAVRNANLVDEITKKLDEFKRREEKILDSFRTTSRNYRRAVSSLTGIKLDLVDDEVYNLYLDDSDFMAFKISRDGRVTLIQNDFSSKISQHLDTYLRGADSVPALMASIIMERWMKPEVALQ